MYSNGRSKARLNSLCFVDLGHVTQAEGQSARDQSQLAGNISCEERPSQSLGHQVIQLHLAVLAHEPSSASLLFFQHCLPHPSLALIGPGTELPHAEESQHTSESNQLLLLVIVMSGADAHTEMISSARSSGKGPKHSRLPPAQYPMLRNTCICLPSLGESDALERRSDHLETA